MAKKSLKAKKPSARPRQSRADSLLVHAQAISELAAAIRQHAEAAASTRGGRAVLETVDTGIATGARLRPLSRADILAGIKAILNTTTELKDDDEVYPLIPGGPARLVAMWEDFDNYPAFRSRGLAIGPNDLRFVKFIGELIGVIAWGLRNALNR